MVDDLRIGVIGAAGRGRLARHAHRPGEGSQVVACYDVKDESIAAAKELYGADIEVASDYRQLAAMDLDAVFVCSPDFLHEEHAVACLEAGKGVYLEKPMSITIEGCDRILRAARSSGARLFVGHNMRYLTAVRKMKQLVDDGAIGEVKSVWCRHFISYGGDAYFLDWHADRHLSTGLLLQKGAHDIDVMHWIAGGYSKKVSAFGNLSVYGDLPRKKEGEPIPRPTFEVSHWPPKSQTGLYPVVDVEDQTVMTMEMDNGVLGAYLQCHFTPDNCRNYTFIGTEGRLENMGVMPDSPIFVWNRRTDQYRLIGDQVHYGGGTAEGGHGGADTKIVDEFLAFVRSGTPTTSTPEAARMAVAAGCQATASLRSGGGALEVPPLPDIS